MRARLIRSALVAGVLAAGPAAHAANDPVTMADNVFQPRTARATVGSAVTWVNRGKAPHEVTAVDGSFSSGNIAPGASYRYTPTRAGSFAYYCRYHGTATTGMTGTLTVSAVVTNGLPKTGGGREIPAGVALLLVTAVSGAGLALTNPRRSRA